jgi:hypothetical protein
MKKFLNNLGQISVLSGVLWLTGTSVSLALNFLGDSILTPEGNSIFLSTNALFEEDSNLGNEIGNAYNLSGNPAISAFELETALNLPDGFLSPDIDNFIEAFEGSGIQKRFEFRRNFIYNFGWTFYSNDERREFEDVITSEIIDASDYGFMLVKKIEIDEQTQEETETLIDFVKLASVNSSEDSGFFRLSNTAGGVRERVGGDFIPVIERPFVREISGIYDLQIPEAGIYDISFGIVDVDDFGDSTSAIAIWERDFADDPFERQEDPTKFRFLTRLSEDGPRYYVGEFERIGFFRDGEHDGRPTKKRDGDDRIPSPFVFSRQIADEPDGLIVNENFELEVIFNISRFGDNPYSFRGWTDLNNNLCFDHPEHPDSTCRDTESPDGELIIDDWLILNPDTIPNDPNIEVLGRGLFKKTYKLNLEDFPGSISGDLCSSRFRLTLDPTEPVLHWGSFLSKEGDENGDVLGPKCNFVPPIPESSNTIGLLSLGLWGLIISCSSFLRKKLTQNQTTK